MGLRSMKGIGMKRNGKKNDGGDWVGIGMNGGGMMGSKESKKSKEGGGVG